MKIVEFPETETKAKTESQVFGPFVLLRSDLHLMYRHLYSTERATSI